MQIRWEVLSLSEECKKKCTHQLNKSRCSDNGANSIGQTTDTGGIKRNGRLKISLNCHDNSSRIHAGPAARHATSLRIIKRNYCRAVVNNALLLKCVPAAQCADTSRRADCNGKSRIGSRSLSHLGFALSPRWPWIDLALSWWSGPRANQLWNNRDVTVVGAAASSPSKVAKNRVSARAVWWYAW